MKSEADSLFDQEEYSSARSRYEESLSNSKDDRAKQDLLFNVASCWAAEGLFAKALNIMSKIEDTPNGDLQYNRALCLYKQSNFTEALDQIEICIGKSNKIQMELALGEDHDHETEDHKKAQRSCLIEALNLKTAVLAELEGNWSIARQCLDQLPVKDPGFLDSVSLHNQAVCDHMSDIYSSIDKLSFLCELPNQRDKNEGDDAALTVPDESYLNLLILYTLSGQTEAGHEFLLKNRGLLESKVLRELLQFLSIRLEPANSDEVVYGKLDRLLDKMIEATQGGDVAKQHEMSSEQRKKLILNLISYQGLLLWDAGHYQLLERLLARVKSILGDDELWKTNLAHTIFMQDTRYNECIQLYESLSERVDQNSLLKVDADLLSCLCVAYVLTGRNGDAEALIKNVEAEELESLAGRADRSGLAGLYNNGGGLDSGNDTDISDRFEASHLCRINLCIGTLYCVKNNYKFGLMRMFKSLEPLRDNLNSENWFNVKRCILALLDGHCKQMIWASDDILNLVVSFLKQCEKYGVQVEARRSGWPTMSTNDFVTDGDCLDQFHGRNSVTYEARHLLSIVLALIHD